MQKNEWTYKANYPALPGGCEEAEKIVISKALRDVPNATAEVVEHRHTPTGRHSLTIRRVRQEEPAE